MAAHHDQLTGDEGGRLWADAEEPRAVAVAHCRVHVDLLQGGHKRHRRGREQRMTPPIEQADAAPGTVRQAAAQADGRTLAGDAAAVLHDNTPALRRLAYH